MAAAYFSIMVTSSHKQKHQQFGLKLLFIAVIVALVFTVWYLSEKRDRSGVDHSTGQLTVSQIRIPADELADMRAIYLKTVQDLFNNGYSSAQLANDYSFKVFQADGTVNLQSKPEAFWDSFGSNYGEIDRSSVSYVVLGNEVKVFFQTTLLGQKHRFLRIFSFSNFDKPNRSSLLPVIWQEALVPTSELPGFNDQQRGEWIGSTLSSVLPEKLVTFQAVINGEIGRVDLEDVTDKSWKVVFFFSSAFPHKCAIECLSVKQYYEEFQKLGAQVYIVSSNLPGTLSAWGQVYFGGAPFVLISDPTMLMARKFGFADLEMMTADSGTLILDSEGKIRYMSVRDNNSMRNVSFFISILKSLQNPNLSQ